MYRVTSKLTIVNFGFEEADLETFFLHVIAAKKLGNSYNQRGEVHQCYFGCIPPFLWIRLPIEYHQHHKKVLSSINTIYDDLEAERSKIMDALSLRVSFNREDDCKIRFFGWFFLFFKTTF